MRRSLLNLVRDPRTNQPLDIAVFKSGVEPGAGHENILDGILYNEHCHTVYPVIHGVPILLDSGLPQDFLEKYAEQISAIKEVSPLSIKTEKDRTWSFSREWKYHFESDVERTWGWSVAERVEQFLLETQVDREWCEGKLILDAGCGTGTLAEALALLGAEVVALDYSSSVFHAEQRRKSSRVHFVRGDLQTPPLDHDIFDLVISIGVLHHTPNTYETFVQVAKLVRPGGLFYLWLYRRPEEFHRRYLKYPLFDLARAVISRLPLRPQSLAITSYARLWKTFHRLLHGRDDIPLSEYVVSAYDDFSPRWRSYHTPYEVSSWFFQNSFSAPTLTHWDNPYGFGCVAEKTRQTRTPGIHYENRKDGEKK